jgi:ubiquinone/menaquinone biosynthesis C-methylase UbiE
MKEAIVKTYDKSTETFGKFKIINNEFSDLILSRINKDSMVLDVGCGGGRLTTSINKFVKKVIGVDYSKELIKYAKKYNSRKNIAYKFMDGEKLDFPSNSFDAVVSHAVINKLMCKAKPTFKSALKVLKPKGNLIIKIIYNTWGKEFNFKGGYSAKEIREILSKLGFKKIKIKIVRQNFKGKSVKSMKGIEDTEAGAVISEEAFEKFYEKCERTRKYSFDDSFMIVMAEK